MTHRLVECVPNFSEGRDSAVLRAISAAIRTVPGVNLLGEESDEDHNRAVVTFVGSPEAVADAAVKAAEVAVARIDLNRHSGVHPRIGALDVLPFVPVAGISLSECAELARAVAQRLWAQLGIPCYLYEAAATTPERRNLERIRKGQFERLREAVAHDPTVRPDIGGPQLHPTAGATAVGARKFLIAWNVWLRTEDVSVAKEIARVIRQSSGGFPFVKALGLPLKSREVTQVSINLCDFEETPPQAVFEAIVSEAAKHKVEVLGSEIIGLVPRRALTANFRESLHLMDFGSWRVLEDRMEAMSLEAIAPAAGLPRLNPAGSGCGLARAFRAIELLLEATALGASPPDERDPVAFAPLWAEEFHWKERYLECEKLRSRLEKAVAEDAPWAARTVVASSALGTEILHIAETTVALQTRISAERARLREDDAAEWIQQRSAAMRSLMGAALHVLLLGASELSLDLSAAEADKFEERLRPFRQLAQG